MHQGGDSSRVGMCYPAVVAAFGAATVVLGRVVVNAKLHERTHREYRERRSCGSAKDLKWHDLGGQNAKTNPLRRCVGGSENDETKPKNSGKCWVREARRHSATGREAQARPARHPPSLATKSERRDGSGKCKNKPTYRPAAERWPGRSDLMSVFLHPVN